jgi:hypothetical protein
LGAVPASKKKDTELPFSQDECPFIKMELKLSAGLAKYFYNSQKPGTVNKVEVNTEAEYFY